MFISEPLGFISPRGHLIYSLSLRVSWLFNTPVIVFDNGALRALLRGNQSQQRSDRRKARRRYTYEKITIIHATVG